MIKPGKFLPGFRRNRATTGSIVLISATELCPEPCNAITVGILRFGHISVATPNCVSAPCAARQAATLLSPKSRLERISPQGAPSPRDARYGPHSLDYRDDRNDPSARWNTPARQHARTSKRAEMSLGQPRITRGEHQAGDDGPRFTVNNGLPTRSPGRKRSTVFSALETRSCRAPFEACRASFPQARPFGQGEARHGVVGVISRVDREAQRVGAKIDRARLRTSRRELALELPSTRGAEGLRALPADGNGLNLARNGWAR